MTENEFNNLKAGDYVYVQRMGWDPKVSIVGEICEVVIGKDKMFIIKDDLGDHLYIDITDIFDMRYLTSEELLKYKLLGRRGVMGFLDDFR